MTRRFRFAPTPSRPIHLGSALAALFGWGLARAAGGTFIVRIEDIDRARCRPEHEATLLDDLRWLGLDWDEGPDTGGAAGPYRQSERFDRYDSVLAKLAEAGLAYPCTCSRNDIRRAASAPHLHDLALGGEIPYPGTCRALPADRPLATAQGGLRLALDAVLPPGPIAWHDALTGPRSEDPRATSGDLLLGRPGQPTYQLAVVVDDIAMGITDVVRGRDLDGSTARQLALRAALRGPPVRHAHHPLIVDALGRKLSKRDEAPPLAELRASGLSPARLIADVGRAIGLFSDRIGAATPADFRDAVAPFAAVDPVARGWPEGGGPPAIADGALG